jgi:HlyD family secretion protein
MWMSASPNDMGDFLGTKLPTKRLRVSLSIGVALGLALLVVAAWWIFGRGTNEPAYATATVVERDVRVSVTATGKLRPTGQVDVGSETSGLIVEVYVDNNDEVKAGQPLARLDAARLRDALSQARAAYSSAEAQIAAAIATRAEARANLTRLEDTFRLTNGGVPSKSELDRARSQFGSAAAQVDVATGQAKQARAQISSAETNLKKATILAPVGGVVLSRKVDPGQTVAATFQTPVLFTIAEDLSRMRLDIDIDEADVAQVERGQGATFTVDAFPGESFPATIEHVDVGANASAAVSATTSTVVAYTARLTVPNPELKLRPGMTATAEVLTRSLPKQLMVPIAALQFVPTEEGDGKKAFITPPAGGPGATPERERVTSIGRGSEQRVFVREAAGSLTPILVTVTAIVGGEAAVTSDRLAAGMRVVTAALASRG